MSTKHEIVITADNKILKRSTNESALEITDTVVATLLSDVSLGVGPVGEVRYLDKPTVFALSLVSKNSLYATVRLPALKIVSTYLVGQGGLLLPTFGRGGDRMSAVWVKPTDIDLEIVMLISAAYRPAEGWYHGMLWLFGMDKSATTWRLPLPNLYDDGRICTGNNSTHQPTLIGLLEVTLAAFANSPWNTDFYNTTTESPKFFRFKADKKDLVTQPIDGDWKKLSRKVGTSLSRYIQL